MIIENKYRISWEHYNKDNDPELTVQEVLTKALDIVKNSHSKHETIAIIQALIDKPIYTHSFSKCIIEEIIAEGVYETVSRGIGIVHPNNKFNRKKGVLVSFDDAVSNIGNPGVSKKEKENWTREQIEEEKNNRHIRTLLWGGFWKCRECKREPIKLHTERDRNLRVFLEETSTKKIRGKHIVYTIPEKTEIYFPRND